MTTEANKDVVRSFYARVINAKELGAIDELLTEDFVHNGEARGRDGQRQAVEYFLTAFPDLQNEIQLILAEDDLVAAHQIWRGTHQGEFLGVRASGQAVDFTSTAVLRMRDGMIAEAWDVEDFAGLLEKLGTATKT